MKSILVPTDDSQTMSAALTCAHLISQSCGGCVTGVGLKPVFAEIVAPDPIVAVPLPPVDWDEAEFSKLTHETFQNHCQANGLVPVDNSKDQPRFVWRGEPAIDDTDLGLLARVYDVTILGRPGTRSGLTRLNTVEAVLFDAGRPVIISPPQTPATLGRTILIAWNQSTETARTVALALPLLRDAERVTILTVESETVPGPDAAALAAYLDVNGIDASVIARQPQGRRPGETICDTAAELGVDLIIKGAYTTSRLRQMIFGGATSHLLAATTVPVFMAS